MNVVVTGASSGIGRATAIRFASRGAAVGLVARRRDRLEGVARACVDAGGSASVVVADVGDSAAREAAIGRIRQRLGVVDVLVNNAGMPGGGSPVADTPLERFDRVMAVNHDAAVHFTAAFLPGMLERRRGAIVNVSSIAGRIGLPGAAAYSASKFALAGFSDALGIELHGRGVSVILVSPGPVHTETFPQERLRSRLLVCEPEDVARAIVRAVDRDRSAEVVLPPLYRLGSVSAALVPSLVRRVIRVGLARRSRARG